MRVLLFDTWRDHKVDMHIGDIRKKANLIFYRLCRDPFKIAYTHHTCPICNLKATHDYREYRVLRKVKRNESTS